jgi:hypothetical protein
MQRLSVAVQHGNDARVLSIIADDVSLSHVCELTACLCMY